MLANLWCALRCTATAWLDSPTRCAHSGQARGSGFARCAVASGHSSAVARCACSAGSASSAERAARAVTVTATAAAAPM